jgi:hypothetical protein
MSYASKGGGNPLPMDVHNVGFLLDRLGRDCSPLQYLRELTQNAIEAVQRTGKLGQIVWDVDWTAYDLSRGGQMKVCIVDTGDGMTGDEMIRFINQLSSSGTEQSFTGNYGVGAKIAAATKNPAGVIYQSWKNGEGNMILLEKLSNGEYGLRQWELEDGTYSHYVPLDDAVKPEQIGVHGTKVILQGTKNLENTMDAPPDAASPSRWISKYLNTRYFEFPAGLTVKAREGWNNPRSDTDRNVLRAITGQKAYLDQHAADSGVQTLSKAKVRWWILKDETAITNNSGFIESAGHVAALYQNELYDRATSRSGTAMLHRFGVLFGCRNIVLYVEPVAQTGALTTDTARTTLLLNGDKLPWEDWAYEFRENMPKQLAAFINEKASGLTEKDHINSIKDRLKNIMDLYKVSRYKPAPEGVYLSDEASAVRVGPSPYSGVKSEGGGGIGREVGATSAGQRDGEVGNIYHLFEKKGGIPSEKTVADPFPRVDWVSIENGGREANDAMEDKAATYVPGQNTLLVNADFRVFKDMISRLCKEKEGPGVGMQKTVQEIVHQWFEQSLVETVIGIQQLRGSKEWGPEEIERALSPEALTSTVMQRYHVYIACRRELGAKFGKFAASS